MEPSAELVHARAARSASLTGHANTTARIAPGLALAVADNVTMTIPALAPGDDRSTELRVASAEALLVAKLVKIADRMSDAARGQSRRVVDKDSLDVLRLLQHIDPDHAAARLSELDPSSDASSEAARAVDVLREHATTVDGALPSCAQSAAYGDPTVPQSMVILTEELLACFE